MPVIALISFFVIVFLIFQKSKAGLDWRVSFLAASLVWGGLLTAITELLSLFRLIGFWEILGVWVISVSLALIFLFRINNKEKSISLRLIPGISRFELLLLAGITLILIIVGVRGWIAPPNNGDAMAYHMSRVIHWLQNRSVAHYPTHILRQLYLNPWAEFAILHFQTLSGSDRFANLIQWFSMAGTTLGVSLLAKQLGASARGQILAAVISITIPMGILQGSSTQTDYVVSFWLVCFVYFALQLRGNGKFLYALAIGASLGLAILTKATAYIYAFPFLVWVGLSLIKAHHLKRLWLGILIGTIAIAVNFGHYARNYDLYGNPLGAMQEEDGKYSNDIFSISSLASNAMRNIGLHMGTPLDSVNQLLENGIYKLHRVIEIDPNDLRTTWRDKEFDISFSFHESIAGNPLHLVLIIATLPVIVLQRPRKDTIYYLVCLVGAFILFSLYLRWQPWNSRLHLPLFVLWSPLLGLSTSQIKFRNVLNLYLAILLLGSLPYALKNASHPILGKRSILTVSRTDLLFVNRPSLKEPYLSTAQFILRSQCSKIGLIMGGGGFEYPIWALLHENNGQMTRLEHVNVTNISQAKSSENAYNAFVPCAIISVNNNQPAAVYVGDNIYEQKMEMSPVSVFMQK
ncbi:MAG: ArnT family glycosyltransferase [Anaerolineales bacterium]